MNLLMVYNMTTSLREKTYALFITLHILRTAFLTLGKFQTSNQSRGAAKEMINNLKFANRYIASNLTLWIV